MFDKAIDGLADSTISAITPEERAAAVAAWETEGRSPKTLTQMTSEVAALSIEKGWRSLDVRFAEHIALAHSELSEALDAYRVHGLASHDTEGKPDDVGSELADALIRLLDMAGVFGYNLANEYERKMRYNWTREYLHGGKTL